LDIPLIYSGAEGLFVRPLQQAKKYLRATSSFFTGYRIQIGGETLKENWYRLWNKQTANFFLKNQNLQMYLCMMFTLIRIFFRASFLGLLFALLWECLNSLLIRSSGWESTGWCKRSKGTRAYWN